MRKVSLGKLSLLVHIATISSTNVHNIENAATEASDLYIYHAKRKGTRLSNFSLLPAASFCF